MKNTRLSIVSIILISMGLLSSCSSSKKSSMNNVIARMEVKEPIKGVCDNSNVLVILPISDNGQVKAQAPKSNEEITQELNARVTYLKDKSDYEDKGMVNLIVNCKGELVQCKIDTETKSPELDAQIVAVFEEMKKWTPGKVHNRPYDTILFYSFTIKKGKISIG